MRKCKPKPTALQMFEGNLGKRSLHPNESKPVVKTAQSHTLTALAEPRSAYESDRRDDI